MSKIITDKSSFWTYLSIFPQFAKYSDMSQSSPYSKSQIDSKVTLLLLPSFLVLIFAYKKTDKWANRLESYSNPFDVEVEIPQVTNAIHEELLENPEEREYNPSAMLSGSKTTLKSLAVNLKENQNQVNELVEERRTKSRVIRLKNIISHREGIPIF